MRVREIGAKGLFDVKGRKRKPTAIKKLAGNPGRHPLNELEPQPELVLTTAPADLTDIGRAKWDELSVLLYNQGILTEMDLEMLHLFCQEYEMYVDAVKNVKAFGGPVVKTDKGNSIQNPYLSVANQCKERMMKILLEFGMSPASRSRVSAAPRARPKSLAEKFFNAPVSVPVEKR